MFHELHTDITNIKYSINPTITLGSVPTRFQVLNA